MTIFPSALPHPEAGKQYPSGIAVCILSGFPVRFIAHEFSGLFIRSSDLPLSGRLMNS
ncbi:MAG: hypothetical protein AB2L21_00385 [Anaerolineaceae bacterium]